MTRGKIPFAPNFTFDEFDCNDGTKVPLNLYPNLIKVARNMQVLRDYVGKPIRVNSGYRTEDYNKKIGGVKNSFHKKALACDFSIEGYTPQQVKIVVEKLIKEGKMTEGGLGTYGTFTHYDAQGVNRRWNG